ncbi:hypothetical protein OsJ_07370 [Oryza sativa Japonica Group]|uniref:Uncharacterized protein n=1 Tax=Oryza sativa subsp. japonica TaxID=39947 RepID=B9F0V3_ORYSJ|nr:hypothetical protein OsJ_07370 [Oryza sativa Japonica Group]
MHSSRFVEFSVRSIEQLVYGRLVPLAERLSGGGAAVDLQEVLLRFTFDNICAVAFGVDAGCLADGLPDVPFARAFELATELSLLRFVTPPFIWKAKRLLRAGSERRLVEATRAVREFAERAVADRRNEMRKVGSLRGRCDLLSRLMSSAPGADYSNEFLRDFCISFILAGRDTSSVGLAWFFWLLAGHPDVESRVVGDVLAAGGDIKRMDYLHAALTEAMRLYPPVPVDFKEALADDVLPDGTPVRARQRVIYYTYAIGRDPASWGDDAAAFRPERWMRGGAFAGGESPFKYAVFNAGPRLCIGKRFAYTADEDRGGGGAVQVRRRGGARAGGEAEADHDAVHEERPHGALQEEVAAATVAAAAPRRRRRRRRRRRCSRSPRCCRKLQQ